MQTEEFLQSGQYLPEFMQDFHDQKLLFKYINEVVVRRKADADRISIEKLPDWISAHVYTVDFFLWIMARHGYTLQKSRKHISNFQDIEKDLSEYRQYLDQQIMVEMKEYNKALEHDKKDAA